MKSYAVCAPYFFKSSALFISFSVELTPKKSHTKTNAANQEYRKEEFYRFSALSNHSRRSIPRSRKPSRRFFPEYSSVSQTTQENLPIRGSC